MVSKPIEVRIPLSKDCASMAMCKNNEFGAKDVFRGGTLTTSSATAWITKI